MPARKKEPEDLTAKKKLALEVIDRLKKEYPDAATTLKTRADTEIKKLGCGA